MVQSPDGTQHLRPMADLNDGSDIPMKGSNWRCFVMEASKPQEDSVRLPVKCLLKGERKGNGFITFLVIEKGDTFKLVDFSLVRPGSKLDYRLQVIYSKDPVPADMLAKKKPPH
jgi:hypothetical protein